jgi:hypothetical protein
LLDFQKEYHRSPTPQDGDILLSNKLKYLADMGIDDESILDDSLIRYYIGINGVSSNT